MANQTYQEREAEAAKIVRDALSLPLPTEFEGRGEEGYFDPWELFPCLYGTYDGDFDKCAIEVLGELISGNKTRGDLGAEMFREMLCTAYLCNYGSSPRVCFPTSDFKPLVPALHEMWKRYSFVQWRGDVCTDDD